MRPSLASAAKAYEVVGVFAKWKPRNEFHEKTLRVDVKNLLDTTCSDWASRAQEFVGRAAPLFEADRLAVLSAAVTF